VTRTIRFDLWGCGRGPAARLAPQARILVGFALFTACLTAPAGTAPGIALSAATAAGWVVVCGLPGRAAKSFLLLGLAMFLPYFLLAPLLLHRPWPPASWAAAARALAGPWDVFWHGLAGLLVAAATLSTLSQTDLGRGLAALPVPRVMSSVIVQVVRQTSELAAETGRVAGALAVRGGSGGARTAWRMLTSLPRVWLPRIIGRADRVAAAMELRGYAEADLRVLGRARIGAADVAALVAATALWCLAAALRWGAIG
jgi:energy-coupling factor transporter transmembrane protein EcfT